MNFISVQQRMQKYFEILFGHIHYEKVQRPTKMSDLIIPPKPIIKKIDLTVASIMKHGDGLIQGLMENPKNAQKFSFLNPDDPFYPFYQLKLEEAKSGGNKKKESTVAPVADNSIPINKPVPTIIPPYFTYRQPLDIGGLQLDVIHLTAQYAALYGREFLQLIAKNEIDSPLFSFLHPEKPYFRLFTSLIDQYKMAIDPSNQLRRRLEQESQSILNVRINLENEAEHNKMVIEQKKKEAEEAKKDETLDQFDWDEFNVLATIDFDDDEAPQPQQQEERNVKMIPRTLKEKKSGITQISPITGQAILIEEFRDHLRYEKIHPQYQKEIDTMKERKANQNSAFATGDQIASNLNSFANDGFKAPENPIIWDGREESIKLTVSEAIDRINEKPQNVLNPDLKKEAPVIGPVFQRKKKEEKQ